MDDFRQRFRALEQFLSGYFHQDWKDDYDWRGETPNTEEVARFFKSQNPPADVARTAEELRRFLSLDDQEIRDALDRINLAYNPRARGLTERRWLETLLRILTDHTEPASTLRFIR
jgi:CdiI immunity protein